MKKHIEIFSLAAVVAIGGILIAQAAPAAAGGAAAPAAPAGNHGAAPPAAGQQGWGPGVNPATAVPAGPGGPLVNPSTNAGSAVR